MDTEPGQGPVALKVRRFVEKPDLATAQEYVRSGRFVWNSGMFVLRPSTLWAELERQQPELLRAFEPVRQNGARDPEIIAQAFDQAASISIDYAVMEGAAQVEVIPALFRWSDVGHWAALDEVSPTDAQGNVVRADAVLDEVKDSVVLSAGSQRVVALSGVEGLVVVDTPDALLVLPRARAQRVRDIVDHLRNAGRDELL
nr:sugar phosphate nucleotidyltransferase [Lujinxingia litoralis]